MIYDKQKGTDAMKTKRIIAAAAAAVMAAAVYAVPASAEEYTYETIENGIKKELNGDINLDGEVDVTDLTRTAAFVKSISGMDDYSLADFNEDGNVDVTDLMMLAGHVKGLKALPEETMGKYIANIRGGLGDSDLTLSYTYSMSGHTYMQDFSVKGRDSYGEEKDINETTGNTEIHNVFITLNDEKFYSINYVNGSYEQTDDSGVAASKYNIISEAMDTALTGSMTYKGIRRSGSTVYELYSIYGAKFYYEFDISGNSVSLVGAMRYSEDMDPVSLAFLEAGKAHDIQVPDLSKLTKQ